MEVTLDQIKDLRERTGAGVMDCKRALEVAEGDVDKAVKVLAEQGIASAAKRADRVTAQGVVDSYIHAGGRIGAIVEVNCETDFVARTEDFQRLAHELAMQVAATAPLVINEEELTEGADGDPKQLALMLQPYIRDPSRSIKDLVTEVIGKTGENIQIRRFSRFELGR